MRYNAKQCNANQSDKYKQASRQNALRSTKHSKTLAFCCEKESYNIHVKDSLQGGVSRRISDVATKGCVAKPPLYEERESNTPLASSPN